MSIYAGDPRGAIAYTLGSLQGLMGSTIQRPNLHSREVLERVIAVLEEALTDPQTSG